MSNKWNGLINAGKLLIIGSIVGGMLSGCGSGGGGSSGSSSSSSPKSVPDIRLSITPSLGQFGEGATVKVKTINGDLIKSGQVDTSGVAVINIPASTTYPLLVEAGINGDQFFDEKLKEMVTIELPAGANAAIRALVPFPRTDIGVTTLTEIAVGMVEGFTTGGIPATNYNDILTASSTVYRLFPFNHVDFQADLTPILVPPSLLNIATAPDSYSLLLTSLSYLAANGKNAMNIAHDLRDDIKDGIFDMRIGALPSTFYQNSATDRDYSNILISDIANATTVSSWDSNITTPAITNAVNRATAGYNYMNSPQNYSACMSSGLHSAGECSPEASYGGNYIFQIKASIYDAIINAANTAYSPSQSLSSFIGSMQLAAVDRSYVGEAKEVNRINEMYLDSGWNKFKLMQFYAFRLSTVLSGSYGHIYIYTFPLSTTLANDFAFVIDPRTPNTLCSYYNMDGTSSPGHYSLYGDCRLGAPTSGGTTPTTGSPGKGYLCPTSKVPFDPDWIQSHGSYWAAASAHDAGLYTEEAQYCAYALPACLAVATNPSDCPG